MAWKIVSPNTTGQVDIYSSDGDTSVIPTNFEMGSSVTYTEPDGTMHLFDLTYADSSGTTKAWKEI